MGTGESELEFPLDSYIGGVSASLGEEGVWSIDLSFAKEPYKRYRQDERFGLGACVCVEFRSKDSGKNHLLRIRYRDECPFFDLIGKYYFLSEVTASDAKGSVGAL